MKPFYAVLLLASLLVAGPAAAKPGADFSGPVHANWHAAVEASGLDMQQPIELTPLAYRRGVALYRLVGLTTGETARVLVALPFDPTARPARPEPGPITGAGCASGSPSCSAPSGFTSSDSSRCTVNLYRDVYYGGANTATNVDWNTFSDVPGSVNDVASSVTTTCAPVYLFKSANWSGSSLYVPASTSIPDLGALSPVSFNDSITSLWHVLP